jgi:outer membrane cobalamin receptor
MDLGIRAKFVMNGFAMSMKCEINNLFDKDYQVIPGYPMPMRSFRVTLGIEY